MLPLFLINLWTYIWMRGHGLNEINFEMKSFQDKKFHEHSNLCNLQVGD
jgi:hypothetical protein